MDAFENDIRIHALEKAIKLIENNMNEQHNKDVAVGHIYSEILKLQGKG